MRNAIEKLQQEYAELFEGKEIRETEDGKFSVIDYLGTVTEYKNPYEIYNRLCTAYPDILDFCEDTIFPRRDGRKGTKSTPVTTRQGLLQIHGLLPGQVGAKYRENTAEIIERFLRADVTLAEQIVAQTTDDTTNVAHVAVNRLTNDEARVEVAQNLIDQVETPEAARRIVANAEVHQQYLGTYHNLHNTLRDRGGVDEWRNSDIPYRKRRNTFAETNRMNTLAVGREPMGNRNDYTNDEKIELAFLQKYQTERIVNHDCEGHEELVGSNRLVVDRFEHMRQLLLA
jgi:hypothetical protein